MPELSDADVEYRTNMMRLDAILDELIEGYQMVQAKDRESGETDDSSALGALGMVITGTIPDAAQLALLAVAVRRLAGGSDASS